MKMLVTGGLGTLGRPLVQELRRRGHEVWVCDLAHHHDRNYARCDVSEFRQFHELVFNKRFDYVYHLAAEFGRWNGEDFYENLWTTNALGTRNVLRLQEEFRYRMVFLSSSEVYGNWGEIMSETVTDGHQIKQLNDYAISKWVNELQILNSAAMNHTETVRVRLFNTYGPGEYYSSYRSAICKIAYSALHDLPYELYINHNRTWSFVTDTIHTLANVVDNFVPGEVYNVGGDEYHDMKFVSDLILSKLKKSDDIVLYKEAEPFTTRDKKIDLTKAIRDLKHQSTVRLEDGITQTIEWMKEAYKDTILRPPTPSSFQTNMPSVTSIRPLIM